MPENIVMDRLWSLSN